MRLWYRIPRLWRYLIRWQASGVIIGTATYLLCRWLNLPPWLEVVISMFVGNLAGGLVFYPVDKRCVWQPKSQSNDIVEVAE